MSVKLISITQSMIPHTDIDRAEQLIVYLARVSSPENQGHTYTTDRLIKYMVKHKHWSPFEMVDVTFEIRTSRAIAQQIIRHRSFSFQEFSQRYAKAQNFEEVELREQSEKNRQSSTKVLKGENAKLLNDRISKHLTEAYSLYNDLLDNGVAKESARMILPLTTSSRLYMKGSVRSWIHYLQIRTAEDTQLEHRIIALQILEIFRQYFPTICEALEL